MSDNLTRRHYEEELAYLRELGEAFSLQNPDIAPLLSARAADPDVERLMEGFAFLTGRLRQRAEEHLPELAQGLLGMLAPHYLRPQPAMTMLRFDAPAAGRPVSVPEGAQVLSRPVEKVACRFRTTRTIELVPAVVAGLDLEERATSATLRLRLRANGAANAAMLAGRPLRLFLHGPREAEPGPQLLHALLTQCTGVEVGDGRTTRDVPPSALRQAGLDEAVLPWPANAFAGFRILQEYLAFPARMLFLELPAVALAERFTGAELEWRFRLDRRLDLPVRPQPEHVQLNVVPAINLFATDGEPILPQSGRIEHRLRPQGAHPNARVFRVDGAEGTVQGRAERVKLPPFASYEHALPNMAGAFHATRLRPSVVGRGAETWISFVNGQDEPAVPPADAISLRLTCTDGELAERIPPGGLDQPAWGCPPELGCRNVVPVTPEASPPIGGGLMWRLVAGLSRSLQPLGDVAALRALIAAHDFRALREEPARQRLAQMLGALQQITTAPMTTLVKGVPVHGHQVLVEAAESGFGGAAGLYLFGCAFEAFLAARAPLNTAWRLEITGSEGRVRLRWPTRAGTAPPL